jgi:hypothetical protein
MRPGDREDMAEEIRAAAGRRRRARYRESQEDDKEGRALQWCSMTRSTRLYSVASSALMK